ncbi:MAG: hypothetical protein ACI38Q_03590 [Candidatus Bruticola sp.]
MKKLIPTLLLLAVVSSACTNNQPSNQPTPAEYVPAASAPQDAHQKAAPKNEATEAIGVCIRYVDRYCAEPDAQKAEVEPLAKALENSINTISNVTASKREQIDSVRAAIKVAQTVGEKVPAIKEDGMENMLEKVITAINNLPEVKPEDVKPGKEKPTYQPQAKQEQAKANQPQANKEPTKASQPQANKEPTKANQPQANKESAKANQPQPKSDKSK